MKYYGRGKQHTGLSTEQPGLKMSGCPSRVGRKGSIAGYISQRVNCSVRTEGCGKKKMKCLYGVNGDTAGKAALDCMCTGPFRFGVRSAGSNYVKVVKRQARTAWMSGGVGRKVGPRFGCKCSAGGKGGLTGNLWTC